MTGSPTADQVSIEETDEHYVHEALRVTKIRKKADEHVYIVKTKNGREVVGNAVYTVSADGKTLTREGTAKHANGEVLQYKEVLEKQ